MLRLIVAALLTLALWAFSSHGRNTNVAAPDTSSPTEITLATLLAVPDRFDGRRVRVSGVASERVVVAGLGGFRVVDATGQGIVVASVAGAPMPGTRIEVTGRFRVLFAAGTASVSGMVDADWRAFEAVLR